MYRSGGRSKYRCNYKLELDDVLFQEQTWNKHGTSKLDDEDDDVGFALMRVVNTHLCLCLEHTTIRILHLQLEA